MVWTELHGRLCTTAFEKVLGKPEPGAMAFVRCLSPEVVERLALDPAFAPYRWHICRVADVNDRSTRTITADRAVELREKKGESVLLLVDTTRAGAGMDGIYSAAQEVHEETLFKHARQLASDELTRIFGRDTRKRAEQALKSARRFGRRNSISYWAEFDFLVRAAASGCDPGALLHLLGLWPAQVDLTIDWEHTLALSRRFVDRLLGVAAGGLTPSQRIESLKLIASNEQRLELERFIRSAATKPLLTALEELADKEILWVNVLRPETTSDVIQSITLTPWRTRAGKIARWSGLVEEHEEQPPVFILKPDAAQTGDYSKLEVRWKARPDNLEKGSVTYRVVIVTDMDEEIAARDVVHSGKEEEKCRFTNDDFSLLNDDALLSAKVIVSVSGNDDVEPQESEEFTIRFGEPPTRSQGGVGREVRTLSEGLIELASRDAISELVSMPSAFQEDARGFVLIRTRDRGKSFRVFRPPLLQEVEQQWAERSETIGRWRVRVRASGERIGDLEFVPFSQESAAPAAPSSWDRVVTASRRMAERFTQSRGGVGQVYDERTPAFDVVKEYLLAWTALLKEGDPLLALAHTVEVQSLSGSTVGLIVLPSHPLRVAWHAAYDNLVLHTAFEHRTTPKRIREEFKILDGSMFPPFLPGLQRGSSFVFADTLRFHAVGMVSDNDSEPKASIAILGRALGEAEMVVSAPTVGRQSAEVLACEIERYIECHDSVRFLHIHALRPGDGLTVARALGKVLARSEQTAEDDEDRNDQDKVQAFVLELYPSREQYAVAGRFIAEAREKRRHGAGVLASEDHWMLGSVSLPAGISVPRLRWARKKEQHPQSNAHLAVAFDTFDSRVVLETRSNPRRSPLFAYGLLSFFERQYTDQPSPCWRSTALISSRGEKHPSDKAHSDRLIRLHEAILRCVARNLALDGEGEVASLRTEISPEKADSLRELHRLCDWVITLDRNSGIEYFDSPQSNRTIYDAYVIDCVPEREDLGCLQLITSTSNLDEVRNLLDGALDQMGLSQSRRNAEFLTEHLKALSGRLAIRLSGQKTATAELIALALSRAHCVSAEDDDECWLSLDKGFFVPLDDVLDLIPPLSSTMLENGAKEVRPDLVYVSLIPRRGLVFRFVEVKYRSHLRSARSADLLEDIKRQTVSLRERWNEWYSTDSAPPTFRAIRRAKLARVLRFYADKAQRHHLEKERYNALVAEIDQMVEKGGDYSFATIGKPDRGWIFCPEYAGESPLEISPDHWDTQIFLFGPRILPDSGFRRNAFEQSLLTETDDHKVAPVEQHVEPREEPANIGLPTEERADTPNMPDSSDSIDREPLSVTLGTDPLTGTDVYWRVTIRGNPHLLVAGLPGMGKTTCLLSLCQQMLVTGVRPIVFSYHEDIDLRLQELVGAVRFIDFHGLGFNPLQVIDRSSRLAYLDVAGALRDIFVAIYPELGDIQGESIRRAIKDSFLELGWGDPNADVVTLPEPQFRRFVDILRNTPRPDRSLRMLLTRLDELDDYGFFTLAKSQESLWDSTGPIVIRIHTTQNDNLQKAFASLVFYGLYKDMFRRGIQSRITHSIIFDEAHRAARLQLIPTMAKECRKYGISLVLASQEAKDFNISVFSAIANYLVLRLNETDAKVLVRNVASSDQERFLIDKIKQMDRFKALYFCEGSQKPTRVLLRSL